MRNRYLYQLTPTRSRRKDSIESDFSSYTGQTTNTSQINQKDRPKYFEEINNQNAPFSHNTIISQQMQYRCMNGDYIQLCNAHFEMKNQTILANEINNQSQISIFLNIKLDQSEDLLGVWISKDIAQTYNSDVLLLECYISGDINQQNIKLINYSILLADELFITCQTIQEFNTFLTLFKQIDSKLQSLIIVEIEQNELDIQQLNELKTLCDFVSYSKKFPSNLIDLQWQYYDYKQVNSRLIPLKKWRGFNLNCRCFFQLAYVLAQFVQNYQKINDIIKDVIYNKVFENIVDDQLNEFLNQYEETIQKQIVPILPSIEIYHLLFKERMKIQENVFEEMHMFKELPYFKLKYSQFLNKIDQFEKEYLTFNQEIIDCYQSKKITDYLKDVYYTKLFDSSFLTTNNILFEISDIFQKLINIFTEYLAKHNYDQLTMFFDKTYKTFLTDALEKVVNVHEKELNKDFANLIELIESLHIQRNIMEEKALYLIDYMDIIKKEIQNMKKIVDNMTLLNQKLLPNYKLSQQYQAQLHQLEVTNFKIKLQIQKEMKKAVKKEKKLKKIQLQQQQ